MASKSVVSFTTSISLIIS
uniref:Uncharacterized protein n=1 Tax=Rhizophora mucronata TaxID=61149 RepID=A0A2P2QNL3_RHIMU